MNKREVIIEKFKVLLASIFPVEETVEVIAEVETVEVTLAEVTLEDGTIITYELLEVDQPINVINADGTLAPLADGDYVINDMSVTVVAGIITNVVDKPIETEVPEPVVIVEAPVMMSDEEVATLVETKLAEVKLAYEDKFAAQKAEFEAQIEELGSKFKETTVIQAPVEVAKVALTYKERLAIDLAEQRKDNRY